MEVVTVADPSITIAAFVDGFNRLDTSALLHGYWRPHVERLGELASVAQFRDWIAERVMETALGIPRLLVSIETGTVVSKTAAGRVALARFPRYGRLLEASLRQRHDPRSELVPLLAAQAPDVVEFGRQCIEVALRAGPRSAPITTTAREGWRR